MSHTKSIPLSLHDALPISVEFEHALVLLDQRVLGFGEDADERLTIQRGDARDDRQTAHELGDRKSTRLNSSHVTISYAVLCLNKKIINHIDSIIMYNSCSQ